MNNEVLFREIINTLCTSKILTIEDLRTRFKLTQTEAETLLSVLISEGFLTKVEVISTCSCAGCPLKTICRIKERNESNLTTITYYRLSNLGLRFCKKPKT